MSEARFVTLQDVLEAAAFPDVDLALRRGRHIDIEDTDHYAFLVDAGALLRDFYKRYDCELVKAAAEYFYLSPTSDRLGRRHLSHGEMLVGQALALMYLDPATLKGVGVVALSQVIELLASIVGNERLVGALNFRLRKSAARDARVAQQHARKEVVKSLRALARLGFVDVLPDDNVRLRSSLMRFTDPVRGLDDQRAALASLMEKGEVVAVGDAGDASEQEDGDEPDAR